METNNQKLTWLQLMWQNNYIQLFALAIIFLVAEIFMIDSFYDTTSFVVGISIPILMMVIIGYKGFYQFWKEYSRSE